MWRLTLLYRPVWPIVNYLTCHAIYTDVALSRAMAQGHRKKPLPSKARSEKKGKTHKSRLCGGVEGDLYGIDSCRYMLQVNQTISL